ncbi:MAG TPA: heme o synthase [Bryobacteraceae bacterium]|nr:heme o synthase [Bryobacteraceae bacterium]
MVADYIALTKPRITWLILMSTGVGYFFGARDGWTWTVLLHSVIGTGLIASGTAGLNQWWEYESDSKMQRTEDRPIPAHRISPRNALIFATLLSLAGFLELWLGANPLTALLGLFTLATYLFIYTPLKRVTPHSTTLGAIPGAMPPMIGYAAARGAITLEAWALFAILFLWQFPHFYAIAWMYREDYSRAGIKMLPVVDQNGDSTVRQILLYSILLVPVSMLPRYLGMTGNIYLAGALILGVMYCYAGFSIAKNRTRMYARRVLLASIIYLPVLYCLMLGDRPHV